MENLLEYEGTVNNGVFAPKNRYRSSIGGALRPRVFFIAEISLCEQFLISCNCSFCG